MKSLKVFVFALLLIGFGCQEEDVDVSSTDQVMTGVETSSAFPSALSSAPGGGPDIPPVFFNSLFMRFEEDDNVEGQSGFLDLSDDITVYVENILRWRNPATGGYSYESEIFRSLFNFNFDLAYRLGERSLNSEPEGVPPNGGPTQPAFAIPTTTPSSFTAPTLSNDQLQQVGLRRLYLFVDQSRKDFVFSSGQEASSLLLNPNYINISRGTGVDGDQGDNVALIIGDPNGSDMYIYVDGGQGRQPLYRYSNPSLGVRFHAIGPLGSNEGNALINTNTGWVLDSTEPIGYVLPFADL